MTGSYRQFGEYHNKVHSILYAVKFPESARQPLIAAATNFDKVCIDYSEAKFVRLETPVDDIIKDAMIQMISIVDFALLPLE